MQPAIRSKIPVRVKNSYNPQTPGTLITDTRYVSGLCNMCVRRFWSLIYLLFISQYSINYKIYALHYTCRDKSNSLVTAITSKTSVQLVDIVSTRMLGQYGFLSEVRAQINCSNYAMLNDSKSYVLNLSHKYCCS